MLVHKGGQINNVQLITGMRIAEMSQLQNCSVIMVMYKKNGNYCENEKREKSGGRGQGGCVQRMGWGAGGGSDQGWGGVGEGVARFGLGG